MADIEIRKPESTEEEVARTWPTWGCEISEFDWSYDDKETCLILEGDVEVETSKETVSFGPGDWVVFPKGLSCRWKVKQAVKKHFKMG